MLDTHERFYTADDYWNLPEGERAELIDGVLYGMAPPDFCHQKLVSELHHILMNHVKSQKGGCEGAPDLIIEVVSPSSRKMDYAVKMNLYVEAGVREYWIVDPIKSRTTVYFFEEDFAPVVFPFDTDIAVGIYGSLSINVAELLRAQE